MYLFIIVGAGESSYLITVFDLLLANPQICSCGRDIWQGWYTNDILIYCLLIIVVVKWPTSNIIKKYQAQVARREGIIENSNRSYLSRIINYVVLVLLIIMCLGNCWVFVPRSGLILVRCEVGRIKKGIQIFTYKC